MKLEKNKIPPELKKEFLENFWLNLGTIDEFSKIKTGNIFKTSDNFLKENPQLHILHLLMQPENISMFCKYILNLNINPTQAIVLNSLDKHKQICLIGCRGFSKTFLISVWAIKKALLHPNSRIIITGAAFRHAKMVYEYCENIWRNAPMLQNILSFDKLNRPSRDIDRCVFRIGTSTITAIPVGNGDTIRGLRSTDLIVDEFNTVDVGIFETVMKAFGAVSSDPITNMQKKGVIRGLKSLGEITADELKEEIITSSGNRCVISGTPGYTFENFYRYFSNYRNIILNKGNDSGENEYLDYRDYCIIRIPHDILLPDYMDDKTVASIKATSHESIYKMEMGAVFISDTEGFFKRSLIESATCGKKNSPIIKDNEEIEFPAMTRGNITRRYVMSIDTASERDNFAVTIIELWSSHRRIVYCWTMNRKKYAKRFKKGLTKEHDFFRYCHNKIRDLLKTFQSDRIVIDRFGGGIQLAGMLQDPTNCREGERPILEIIEDDVEKITDNMDGHHILQFFNPTSADDVMNANHFLKQDLEEQNLIFPKYDSITLANALAEEKALGKIVDSEDSVEDEYMLYDSLENCMLEIEDIKNELITIVHSKSDSGRDRWSTPEVKGPNSKKGRLKKDRYSSLLMGNFVARQFNVNMNALTTYKHVGGVAKEIANDVQNNKNNYGKMYQNGPKWFTDQARTQDYGFIVKRKV